MPKRGTSFGQRGEAVLDLLHNRRSDIEGEQLLDVPPILAAARRYSFNNTRSAARPTNKRLEFDIGSARAARLCLPSMPADHEIDIALLGALNADHTRERVVGDRLV